MKKIIWVTGISVCIIFTAWTGASAQTSNESVTSFDAAIAIQEDGSFLVTETILYDFGNTRHHGIYRDIPYAYERNGTKYKTRMDVLSVEDGTGQAWPYTVSRWSGNVSIKIGDPDEYVTGEQEYVVTYSVQRAINYFDDHDELYWNVTGNEWAVPIYSASTTVTMPQSLADDQWQVACYTGYLGSQDSDCTYSLAGNDSLVFQSDDYLSTGEGLTIVVGWPKDIVTKPGFAQQLLWFATDNWPVIIPLLVLLVMFFLWYTRGRDPKGRGTIIPYYEAPDNLTAGEVGTVVDERFDLKDISATIIQLSIKGYLKIKEIEQQKILGKKKDYELIQQREPDNSLERYEKEILEGIFDTGKSRTVSSMKNNFYVHLKKIKKEMYQLVVEKNYFPTNPEKVRNGYTAISSLVIPLGIFLAAGFENIVAGIATIISGVIALIFSRFMPRKTKHGAVTREKIEGFKLFLSVTEKERIKFHNAPEKSPKQFEIFLPYAMTLGVEKQWAEQFKDMYITPPEWYEGSPGSTFGALYLAGALGSMSSDLHSAMPSKPGGGAGSGGSGFGGGGFSGGGFGGGGGGSW